MQNTPLNKRFWKTVDIRPEPEGFAILLDERPLKTPSKAPLLVPTKPLAEALAAEWAAVEGEIDPRQMHLTRCANATIDKVVREHASVAEMLAEYGATDLLCYRADAPAGLVERQDAAWNPVLAWLEKALGISLVTTTGIMFVQQAESGQRKLLEHVKSFDPWQLTAFHDLVTISGSLVLALAVTEQHLSPEEIWELSRVDDIWQQEQWGIDDEAVKVAALKRADYLKAARLLDLLAG